MSERSKLYEEKMEKTLRNLDGELQSVRAGRANPHVLDKITVDYYGSPTATGSGSPHDHDFPVGRKDG